MNVQSMKKATAQLFSVLALLALVGCAMPTPPPEPPSESKPDRPDWAMTEPDDEDGM